MSDFVTSVRRALGIRSSSQVDLRGSQSMFGSIGNRAIPIPTSKDFIPNGFQGETIDLTGGDMPAHWLGLQGKMMQHWAYRYCAPLASVIDRLAAADANGRFEFINKDYTTRSSVNKNPKLLRIKRLFERPNPYQTSAEFQAQQLVIAKTHGYCPVLFICPVGFDKSYSKFMFNLDPIYVSPSANFEFDLFDDSKGGPIKEWTGNVLGSSFTIRGEDVLLIKDGFVEDNVGGVNLPVSRIAGLDYFISNICAAMEADNVLLKKKGPLGVFSHDPKPDMAGWIPLSNDQKDELQTDLKRYGLTLGQLQYIISKTPLKWNAMSFNLRDLMTKETTRQGIDGICDRFDYPAELMSGKNATYENRNSAEKFLYQNNVIPFSLRKADRYTIWFNIEDCLIHWDYDHLPVLQEDSVKAAQAEKFLSEALELDWKGGMITRNQWREAKGYDTVSGEDIYYPEWAADNGISLTSESQDTNKTKIKKKNGSAQKDTGTEE